MMYPDRLTKDPTKRTPWIILEPGRIFIMGRSIPENPGDFYRPVLEWITMYAKDHTSRSRIEFGFEYINTASTKWVYGMLKEIAGLKDLATEATVTWYYEQGDDDMCELGFILRSLVECPFVVVEMKEMDKEGFEQVLQSES
jgi:hypothetical protein